MEAAVVEAFLTEIGAPTNGQIARSATFAGVSAALGKELLLPLRALLEGQNYMCRTHNGEGVPAGAIATAVQDLITATLSKPGGFSEWRYNNSVGAEQLRGLSQDQLQKWKEPTSMLHAGHLRTHEDEEGELGFFWATKIGGPSHGFDIGGQCLLPLLANARNKVVLVSHPDWPAYPAGRAHLRLLWTAPRVGATPTPRLWLEALNCDFDAVGFVDSAEISRAALRHAVEKAETMRAALSVDPVLIHELAAASSQRAQFQGGKGVVEFACERLALRPSNGVCEASDCLSKKHDWVQLQEEVTEPIQRALYVPASCNARRIEQLGR